VLLSDRDIRAELASGRVALAPLDLAMVHPADITPYGEIPEIERALAG